MPLPQGNKALLMDYLPPAISWRFPRGNQPMPTPQAGNVAFKVFGSSDGVPNKRWVVREACYNWVVVLNILYVHPYLGK